MRDNEDFGCELGAEYARGDPPYPERLHVNALVFDFMWRYTQAVREWAQWARGQIERWDGVGDQPARRQAHLATYRRVFDEINVRRGAT